MRFSVTPSRAKSIATQFGRCLPALAHTTCLNLVAQIAGYRDWHELQHVSEDAALGQAPELPLKLADWTDGLFPETEGGGLAAELLEQAYRALGALGSCPALQNPAEGPRWRSDLLDLLIAAGAILVPAMGARKALAAARDLPPGHGVFYQLAHTEAAGFAPKGVSTRRTQQEVRFLTGQDELRGAQEWVDRGGAAADRAFVERLALAARRPDPVLTPSATGLVVLQDVVMQASTGDAVDAVAIVSYRLDAPRESHTARLTAKLSAYMDPAASRWPEADGDSGLPGALGMSAATLLQRVIGPLCWAMFGVPARLEVHVGAASPAVEDQADAGYAFASSCIYDLMLGTAWSEAWQADDSLPGIHLLVAPGLYCPPPARPSAEDFS